MAKWREHHAMGSKNYILQGDGFYISFNPDPNSSHFGAMFGSDNGDSETALCKDGAYHILNGDYRVQYEKLMPGGWIACKKFYNQQSAHADSSWSQS